MLTIRRKHGRLGVYGVTDGDRPVGTFGAWRERTRTGFRFDAWIEVAGGPRRPLTGYACYADVVRDLSALMQIGKGRA